MARKDLFRDSYVRVLGLGADVDTSFGWTGKRSSLTLLRAAYINYIEPHPSGWYPLQQGDSYRRDREKGHGSSCRWSESVTFHKSEREADESQDESTLHRMWLCSGLGVIVFRSATRTIQIVPLS